MRTIALECEGDTFCVECAPNDATLSPIFSVEDWRFFFFFLKPVATF
jgi:hypothetical protein